jgi:hypothetical protein
MKPEEAARRLAGLAGREVAAVAPVASESRNGLARVLLSDGERAVLKFYDPGVDPHAANRFRREEKVLTLMGGEAPPVTPRPLAGFIAPVGPCMLLMQDAGNLSLADRLMAGDGSGAWEEAIAFVTRLHAAMQRLQGPLRATAAAIDLDRITAGTLAKRFEIAANRILGRKPSAEAASAYAETVAPLLDAPGAMIHNSLSPLNLVVGDDGLRAIDWETLAWASPLWDWAELLRSPYRPLPLERCEALAAELAAGSPGEMFLIAVLARHLDSLGTVVLRRRLYDAEGRRDRATEYARRAHFYAEDIECVMERLAMPPDAAADIREMTRAVRSDLTGEGGDR